MEACLLRTSDIFNRYKKYVAEKIDGPVNITMEVEEEKNRPWSSSRHIRIDLECEEDESLNYELRLSNHQDSGWRLSATINSPLGLGEFNLPDQEIEIDLYSVKGEVTLESR
jgi:type II secretory pathway component HofQ